MRPRRMALTKRRLLAALEACNYREAGETDDLTPDERRALEEVTTAIAQRIYGDKP